MQATTRGEKTSAGQGMAGGTKSIETPEPCASQTPAVTRSCSTAVTKASPQRRGTTSPVYTTTEADVPASNSDQATSDCISGVFVWPTPGVSAAATSGTHQGFMLPQPAPAV